MKDFSVSVTKVTDEALMREACEMTFLGASKQDSTSQNTPQSESSYFG